MLSPRFRTPGGTGLIALVLIAALVLVTLAVAAAPTDVLTLRSAYDATTKAQAYRFVSTRTVTIAADTAPDLSFATNGEQVGQDRLHTSTTVATGSIRLDPIETTEIGQDRYIHLSGSLTPNGIDQWLQLDVLGGLLSGVINPIALQQASPADALDLLTAVNDAQTMGDETINGVTTTHLRGTIDLARVTGTNGPFAGLGNIYAGPQSTATVDAYVGKDDGLVHRLAFMSVADVDLSTLNLGTVLGEPPGSLSTNATTAATFDFTDYNNSGISVNPPTQFMRISDYLNNFNLTIVLPNVQAIPTQATGNTIATIGAVTTTAPTTTVATASGTTTTTTTATAGVAGTRFPATGTPTR